MAEITVQGERWFPSEKTFSENLSENWGPWGVDSECGKLRAVLMHRPGPEIDNLGDPRVYRFKAAMDPETARRQHDALADVYRAHGVRVFYAQEGRADRPNAMYMRDLVFMTPEGAIVGRPAMAERRGEERYAAQALGEYGVPIVKSINGEGTFEGACALWVDRRTVILGTGSRCNAAGAAQVEAELRNIGVEEIIPFQIPYGHAHLDGLLNFPDRKIAVIFPWQVPYDVCRPLLDRGFNLIEMTRLEEVKHTFAVNFVAIEPGRIVMPQGNPHAKALMEEAGISVIEVDLSEIIKGWGAAHCMTAFLKRDPI